MGPEFDSSWARISGTLTAIMVAGQLRTIKDALEYIPEVLEENGQEDAIPSRYRVNQNSLLGVSGDGYAIDDALYGAVITAKTSVGEGFTPAQALARGGRDLQKYAALALSDTGRGAERLSLAPRPVSWYVRMLQTPSCGRCVILAGKTYRMAQAFQRHPRCDCRHIPAAESTGGDMTVDPQGYFDSLSQQQQDEAFGVGGAEAIRSGADMNQVVNAQKGMYTTAEGRFTRTGISRRGLYGASPGARLRGNKKRPRLMPEQIQKIARDKDEYLRLLQLYRYIF